MKSLPNILTGARLIMALFVFVAISIAVGGFPPISDNLAEGVGMKLQVWAVVAFFVAVVWALVAAVLLLEVAVDVESML